MEHALTLICFLAEEESGNDGNRRSVYRPPHGNPCYRPTRLVNIVFFHAKQYFSRGKVFYTFWADYILSEYIKVAVRSAQTGFKKYVTYKLWPDNRLPELTALLIIFC